MSNSASKVGRCDCRLTRVAAYPSRMVRALGPVEGLERGDRVQVLGQRDRQPGGPQRLQEGDVPVDQATPHRQPQLLDGPLVVGVVLEDHAEGVGDRLLVEVPDLQRDQGARPVDRLGDRRRLLELQLAQPADGGDQLLGDPVVEAVDLGGDDLPLPLGIGVAEVQVEAAPLHGLGQLAGGVGGEDDVRASGRDDGAELGDRDLEVGEHLEQQPLDLDVGLVDLVDEQHRRLVAADRGQQRTGEQELVGEDVVVRLGPRRASLVGLRYRSLDAEQLLLVVPLVERARLVETLVALEPDQLRARGARRPPSPARSCRHRPGPRRAAASPARRRGTPSWPSSDRRGSRPPGDGRRRRRES